MEYRTHEQFLEIIDSAINGNWRQAAQEAVDYGFYANDLIKHFQEETEIAGTEKPFQYFDSIDLAIISEMAAEIRYKKEP